MTKLIAYAFANRRDMPCYRCGGTFKEGRYREHIRTSKHPSHEPERPQSGAQLQDRVDSGKDVL